MASSFGISLYFSNTSCTIRCFNFKRSSEILVPRPVASSAVSPANLAVISALAVVLEIPISPTKNTLKPSSIFSFTRRIPVSIPSIACSRVMAGSSTKFFVPMPSL